MKKKILIAPSVLASDFSRLAEEVKRAEEAGADLLHFDIMDGHFVPNITFGPGVMAALRKHTRLPFDVHLMITNPADFIDAFIDAGAACLSFHIEAESEVGDIIEKIKDRGVKAGIVLNPPSEVASIEEFLEAVDFVLAMTVNPGFGAQDFIPGVLEKIKVLRKKFAGDIEVDGGINRQNAPRAKEAGCNILVAGTALFGAADMKKAIKELRSG